MANGIEKFLFEQDIKMKIETSKQKLKRFTKQYNSAEFATTKSVLRDMKEKLYFEVYGV